MSETEAFLDSVNIKCQSVSSCTLQDITLCKLDDGKALRISEQRKTKRQSPKERE